MRSASDYWIESVLPDGSRLLIRSIRPDDREALRRGFRRLGVQSVYQRFLGAKNPLRDDELTYLTEVDFQRHVALVAELRWADENQLVGVGRYVEIDCDKTLRCAEIALTVADEYQSKGVGSTLFEHLVRIALRQGIQALEAEVFASNESMLRMFQNSGFPVRQTVSGGVVRVAIQLTRGWVPNVA